ncbi:MAG TPA: c-type cytochrome [Candidatus Binatia bacterium]|jgi:cytochrome c2
MRWVGRIIAAVAVLLGTECLAFAQPLFSPTQDPIAGSRVFGSKGCSSCHSIDGVGAKAGPDLGRARRAHSFYEFAAAIWNHLPGMAERMRQAKIQRPSLSPGEAADLIAFLYTLDYFDPPGNAETGKRLFTEKKCIVCHQSGGAGGVVGPNLDSLKQYGSAIFVAAAMWNHGPAMAEAMRARGIARPTFSGSELVDLIAFLKSAAPDSSPWALYILPGSPESGRQLFQAKRCIECHSAAGQGGKIGPDLADKALQRSMTEFAAAMWNKAPAMTAAMKSRRIAVPRLEAADMSDIVAYLYSVQYFARPGDGKKGRELAAQKGCLACHSIDGKAGKGAPDLARVKGLDAPQALIAALWNHSFLTERRLEGQKILWPQFRADEMAHLAAFLQELARGGA